MHRDQEQWMRDIELRQRNIVFPDTANNQARLWRNVIDGHQGLTTVQWIGLFVIYVPSIVALIAILFPDIADGFSFRRFLSGVMRLAIAAVVILIFMGALTVSCRRAEMKRKTASLSIEN